jgi:adenylylsulfate kinase
MSKTNIVPHQHKISKADRQKNNGHGATIVWFTGLSGSGKSTLASYVEELLFKDAVQTYILDGDNVRSGLNSDLSFSPEDRGENIRRIGEVAKLFVDAGVVVLTAFVSPYENDREFVRGLVEEGEFIEVFVDCPLEVCEERDPKGLYRKARSGEISNFTGVSAPFEPPQNPELTVNTAEEELTSLGENVYTYIQSRI